MMDRLNWAYGIGSNITYVSLFNKICNSFTLSDIKYVSKIEKDWKFRINGKWTKGESFRIDVYLSKQ